MKLLIIFILALCVLFCPISFFQAENKSSADETLSWPPREPARADPVVSVSAPGDPRERSREGYIPGGEGSPISGTSYQDRAALAQEEVAPHVFEERDTLSPLSIDPQPFADVEFAESPVFLIVGGPDSTSKKIDDFEESIPLGLSYRAKQYPSEEAASEGAAERGLGVPYTIRTPIQERARKQGY